MPGASRLDCRNQRHPAFFMSVWADPECCLLYTSKKPGNLAKDALSAKAHQSVRNADQDNNSGVEAAHFTEGSAEGAARAGSRFQYGRKLRQYKKLERLEKKADKDAVDSIFAERMKSDPQDVYKRQFGKWCAVAFFQLFYRNRKSVKRCSVGINKACLLYTSRCV